MNKLSVISFLFSLVAMALAAVAVYFSSARGIEQTLVKDPQILLNASKSVEKVLQEEAIAKQEEAARKAEKTILDNIEAFNNDPASPFVGPKDAKAVVVEFFDFACGYCHALAPTIEGLVSENADVKFVFKPLAFLSKASDYAARAFLAAHIQNKGYDFYKNVMAINSGLSEEKINEAAKKAGIDMEKLSKDMNSEVVEATMRANADLARKAEINGVPLLIFNGKMMHAIDKTELQNSINAVK